MLLCMKEKKKLLFPIDTPSIILVISFSYMIIYNLQMKIIGNVVLFLTPFNTLWIPAFELPSWCWHWQLEHSVHYSPSVSLSLYLCVSVSVSLYIYIDTHTCTCYLLISLFQRFLQTWKIYTNIIKYLQPQTCSGLYSNPSFTSNGTCIVSLIVSV